jgi:cytochrome P450
LHTGDFVRYGPDRLLINSADGFHGMSFPPLSLSQRVRVILNSSLDIYGHNKNVTKSKAYYSLMPPDLTHSVLSAWDKIVHGRKRRVIGQGFTEPAVRGYEPIIKENINIFCKTLLDGDGRVPPDSPAADAWSPPMDMAKFGKAEPRIS